MFFGILYDILAEAEENLEEWQKKHPESYQDVEGTTKFENIIIAIKELKAMLPRPTRFVVKQEGHDYVVRDSESGNEVCRCADLDFQEFNPEIRASAIASQLNLRPSIMDDIRTLDFLASQDSQDSDEISF